MLSQGFNPLRWNCTESGCFNKLKRPKIEYLAEALPGRMAFSDVDAITEYKGHFLLLEWKSFVAPVPTGQRIMFERMSATGRKTKILVVVGNAETMEVTNCLVYADGRSSPWEECTLDGLKDRIREWVNDVNESTKAGRTR